MSRLSAGPNPERAEHKLSETESMSTKGDETRDRILAKALQVASVHGLSGLTIGELAQELQLSKSGLFAHFQSKERLQAAVLDAAGDAFATQVIRPALTRPRGEPRVVALFEHWLKWALSDELPGGCVFVAASAELDDQPGILREKLCELQGRWFDVTVRAAAIAVEAGHFDEDTDPHQFAFELHSIYLGFHHLHRLLQRPDAAERTQRAFQRLLLAARGAAARNGTHPLQRKPLKPAQRGQARRKQQLDS